MKRRIFILERDTTFSQSNIRHCNFGNATHATLVTSHQSTLHLIVTTLPAQDTNNGSLTFMSTDEIPYNDFKRFLFSVLGVFASVPSLPIAIMNCGLPTQQQKQYHSKELVKTPNQNNHWKWNNHLTVCTENRHLEP